MNASEVKLEKISNTNPHELSDIFIIKCSFCTKKCNSTAFNYVFCEKLSTERGYHCPFCLRHNFHHASNKDVLIFSFRATIGFLYQQNYLISQNKKLFFHDIIEIIECHRKTGLQNPTMVYDEESLLWFANFTHIGDSPKKVSVEETLQTIVNIFACFNFAKYIPQLDIAKYFLKYKKAVEDFHTKRYRPPNRSMLIPTFNECLSGEYLGSFEKLRNFSKDSLICKKFN